MLGINQKQRICNKVLSIPIGKIRPNARQPRKQFDNESLLGLAQSILQNGILQPLSVRKLEEDKYELIAGERRLRAALIAGLSQVPCIEIKATDIEMSVLSLLENLQREGLNFFEEAEGFARLIEDCGLTQEEIALSIGKTQSTIANKLRLLRISESDRDLIVDAKLTERHSRALLRLENGLRTSVLKQIITRDLNVSETEKLIESLLFPGQEKKGSHSTTVIKDVRLFLNTVNNAVNIMKRAGIDAVAVKQEFPEYYEYTVRIPKSQQKAQRA